MSPQWDETSRDNDLVNACLQGDETAWASLVRRYRRLIYTIPLRFGMPLSAAEEIFQEVSLILLQKLHTLRDETRLSAWIVTVTRRACMQRWRQLPAAISIDELTNHPDEAGSDMEEALLNLERRHTLQQAMEQLDERCHRLIQALFLTDPPASYQEMAQALGVPEGSIGPTRARCLDKLRRIVAEIQGE
jgi:RNA polymerase sigma factor (sigma-70 family)